MNHHHTAIAAKDIAGWIASIAIITTGILNLLLVHPVPALGYLVISLIYLPPVNRFVLKKTGYRIPLVFKILLGVALFLFTLGVSDLGEMID